ncbi:DUF1492 domain-containing protein [Defluviitalea saccharophila]|uniref:DUF1492 domain-containing protein n=1 Tax=Defluviitalea saccharophila TaxID=879970 RepID=A0ABZ2Y7R7_9FIRM
MNYIKEAENYLNHYKDLYFSIKIMEKQLDKIIKDAGPKDISSTQINDSGVRTAINQDEAINTLFKIKTLKENITETKKKLEEIDEILTDLKNDPESKIYADILRMWYIEGKSTPDILREVGYSERQFFNIKKEAIRIFAVRILGIKALEVC